MQSIQGNTNFLSHNNEFRNNPESTVREPSSMSICQSEITAAAKDKIKIYRGSARHHHSWFHSICTNCVVLNPAFRKVRSIELCNGDYVAAGFAALKGNFARGTAFQSRLSCLVLALENNADLYQYRSAYRSVTWQYPYCQVTLCRQ